MDDVSEIMDGLETGSVGCGKELVDIMERCRDEDCRRYGAEDAHTLRHGVRIFVVVAGGGRWRIFEDL